MKFFGLLIVGFFSVSIFAAEPVDRVLAVVNDEIVTASELKGLEERLKKSTPIDDLLLFGKPVESLKANQAAQLNYLINEKIIASEIKRLNLSVTIERIEQEIREMAKSNGMTRAQLMDAVRGQGLSPSEYQEFIRNRVERQALIEREITSKIRISDEDVAAQFSKQNPTSTSGIYEYTLAHILFNSKKGGAESAKERAEEVLKKLRAGGSFDKLAEQNSEDPSFSQGGHLGTFKAGEFNKDMESAVERLGAGEVSDVLPTRGGFHIVKVVGKKLISDPRFDREKDRIRNILLEKAFQKHLQSWLESKKEDSFIRINK